MTSLFMENGIEHTTIFSLEKSHLPPKCIDADENRVEQMYKQLLVINLRSAVNRHAYNCLTQILETQHVKGPAIKFSEA